MNEFWILLEVKTKWKKIKIQTKSCRSKLVIFSTILHSHRLNLISFSPLSLDSSLNVVYEISVLTLISPTPFKSNRKSSAVKKSNVPLGNTSNTPDRKNKHCLSGSNQSHNEAKVQMPSNTNFVRQGYPHLLCQTSTITWNAIKKSIKSSKVNYF